MHVRFVLMFAILLLAPFMAHAEEEAKAQITVSNDRREPITMRFEYAFRDMTWRLMEQQIPIDEEITYRYPSNIPGCAKLHEWRIADGVLTVSNAVGPLCRKRVSLCDANVTLMTVAEDKCLWRVRQRQPDGSLVDIAGTSVD